MKDPFDPPLAVALSYDGTGAPRVVAKGAGELAERILATAHEHGVPLQSDAELVQLLAQLELGQEIPRALYVAVAQVLAFAWFVTGRTPAPRAGRHHANEADVLEGRIVQ
jgi:flagellar biosynthesis protein